MSQDALEDFLIGKKRIWVVVTVCIIDSLHYIRFYQAHLHPNTHKHMHVHAHIQTMYVI